MELLDSSIFRWLVTDLMRRNHIPGLSVAVVYNNTISSTGFGVANIEDQIPCTGDTLFDFASCSKSLTAASVALLVDDDKYPDVQYEALMSYLLPGDFVMQEQVYTDGVTVEDVLSHRTGLASHDSSYMGPSAAQPDNAESVTRNLRNLKVAAPLRSRYIYNNQMFTVASYLVEKTAGQNFSDFLDERIFNPLEMNSTTLQPASAIFKGWGSRIAKGYVWEDDAWHGYDARDCPEGQGAGSIISSTSDFIKFVKALLNQEGPINDKVYQGLTKMRTIVNPSVRRLKAHTTPTIYTAGMEMHFYREKMVIGHDGYEPGYASRFIFLPDLKFAVVVIGNTGRVSNVSSTITRALVDEVLGVPAEERTYQTNSKRRDDGQREQSIKAEKKDKKKNQRTQQPQVQKKRGKPQKQQEARSPQTTPLDAYVGNYWNAGYHTMTVELKDDQLYVDATDRSMGFTITFEHVTNNTDYIAHVSDDLEHGDDPIDASFVFDEGKVVKMGLNLEPAIKELIWFERKILACK